MLRVDFTGSILDEGGDRLNRDGSDRTKFNTNTPASNR